MKKLLICMAAAATMLSGVTAMASDGYSSADNSVTVADAAGSKVVLISKNTGSSMNADDIVYIGQDVSATEFFLKENPDPGFYTIVLGDESGDTRRANFVIGDAANVFSSDKVSLTPLDGYEVSDGAGKVTKAYVSATDITLDNIKTIVVTYNGKSVYHELGTELSGGGTANVGIKLTAIPEEYKNDVSVFVSSDKLSNRTLITD